MDWVMVTFLKSKPISREVAGLSIQKPRDSVDAVVQRVAHYYGCHSEHIKKRKKKNVARDVAICILRETTGEATVSLGNFLCGINGHAVTMRCTKVKEELKDYGRLRRDMERLLKNCQ